MSKANPEELHALDMLERLSGELSTATDANAAHLAVLSAACELCGAERGTIHISTEPTSPIRLVSQLGFDQADAIKLDADLCRANSSAHRAAREQAIVSIENVQLESVPEAQLAARHGHRAVHSVPLVDSASHMVRVLTLYFRNPTRVPASQSQWVRAYLRHLSIVGRAHDEQASGASEERFRSIFQESNDFIITADLSQKITYCNPATAHALGWTNDEVVGRSIAEFIPPPHFDRTSAMLERKLQEGGSTRYEVEVFARDGRRMTWEINSRLTFDASGKPTGLHAIGRDVTKMRAAHEELRKSERRLREADQRKDEFLAMLAHELRNPLAPIRTAADVFKRPAATPEQIRNAGIVLERQVEHITRIVDDLLDVSRVTRGLVTFAMKPTYLHDVVYLAAEQVRPLMQAKQHRLNITLPDEPLVLSGEAVRLVQMIANLLHNAALHSGKDQDIDLSVVANVQLIEIHVRDRGAGIAADLLPRVFELFAQSERSVARSEGGLGIGLALVRRIAELHGGHVEAHSEGIGRGAHFVVVLPRLAEPRQTEVSSSGAESPSATARPLRILVVDDNEDAANMLSMLLDLEGHSAMVAYDAKSALKCAGAEQFDVMLLDIGLPDMSGYELAEQLRASPSSGTATLIAVTGYGQTADQRRSQQAGFDHHLTKPVSTEMLQGVLSRL